MEMKTCNILGVDIAVTNMKDTVNYIIKNIESLQGQYICVSNVHTTVMSYEDEAYRKIQNSAALVLPDGKPLSMVSRKRGYPDAQRVTGPDLMHELFEKPLKHYFYGGKEDTLIILEKKLKAKYPEIQIAGMYSPPFRPLTEEEDDEDIKRINESGADVIWVGLGAPKQEKWMYAHKGKMKGLMIGVGAGFDYHADVIKRAPEWMQRLSLEWLYRLFQDPKRLWKRYLSTNFKFVWLVAGRTRG